MRRVLALVVLAAPANAIPTHALQFYDGENMLIPSKHHASHHRLGSKAAVIENELERVEANVDKELDALTHSPGFERRRSWQTEAEFDPFHSLERHDMERLEESFAQMERDSGKRIPDIWRREFQRQAASKLRAYNTPSTVEAADRAFERHGTAHDAMRQATHRAPKHVGVWEQDNGKPLTADQLSKVAVADTQHKIAPFAHGLGNSAPKSGTEVLDMERERFWGTVADWFVDTWEDVKDVAVQIYDTAVEVFNHVVDALATVASYVWDAVVETYEQAKAVAQQIWDALPDDVKHILEEAGQVLVAVASRVAEDILNTISAVTSVITSWIASGAQWIIENVLGCPISDFAREASDARGTLQLDRDGHSAVKMVQLLGEQMAGLIYTLGGRDQSLERVIAARLERDRSDADKQQELNEYLEIYHSTKDLDAAFERASIGRELEAVNHERKAIMDKWERTKTKWQRRRQAAIKNELDSLYTQADHERTLAEMDTAKTMCETIWKLPLLRDFLTLKQRVLDPVLKCFGASEGDFNTAEDASFLATATNWPNPSATLGFTLDVAGQLGQYSASAGIELGLGTAMFQGDAPIPPIGMCYVGACVAAGGAYPPGIDLSVSTGVSLTFWRHPAAIPGQCDAKVLSLDVNLPGLTGGFTGNYFHVSDNWHQPIGLGLAFEIGASSPDFPIEIGYETASCVTKCVTTYSGSDFACQMYAPKRNRGDCACAEHWSSNEEHWDREHGHAKAGQCHNQHGCSCDGFDSDGEGGGSYDRNTACNGDWAWCLIRAPVWSDDTGLSSLRGCKQSVNDEMCDNGAQDWPEEAQDCAKDPYYDLGIGTWGYCSCPGHGDDGKDLGTPFKDKAYVRRVMIEEGGEGWYDDHFIATAYNKIYQRMDV